MCRRPGGVDFGGVQGVVGCEEGVAVAVVVGGLVMPDGQSETILARKFRTLPGIGRAIDGRDH